MKAPTFDSTKEDPKTGKLTKGENQGTVGDRLGLTRILNREKENPSTKSSKVTGGDDAVTVDKTVPTITTASIASNNSSGDELAVPGNIITLTIVSNEDIVEPTVSLFSKALSYTAHSYKAQSYHAQSYKAQSYKAHSYKSNYYKAQSEKAQNYKNKYPN